jgi:polyisoprenoid-binding protein YceI
MKQSAKVIRGRNHLYLLAVVAILLTTGIAAAAPDLAFRLDTQQTKINFTLGDALHTVRGTFQLKQGALHLEPASGQLTGEIVVDARSGESGSGMRDRKMHREVLESDHYPEIVFHPDRVEGPLSPQGTSSVRVHGIFAIHGSDHELMAPADVEITGDRWTAKLHFAVPYAKWGMKNPSTLFLRVSESVDIDMNVAGSVARP